MLRILARLSLRVRRWNFFLLVSALSTVQVRGHKKHSYEIYMSAHSIFKYVCLFKYKIDIIYIIYKIYEWYKFNFCSGSISEVFSSQVSLGVRHMLVKPCLLFLIEMLRYSLLDSLMSNELIFFLWIQSNNLFVKLTRSKLHLKII